MLKASHRSKYVKGTTVNMKNVVSNFVTSTGTIHRGLKHVTYDISMEMRLVNILSPNCKNSFTLALHTLLTGNCDHVTKSMKARLNLKCTLFSYVVLKDHYKSKL